MGQKVNPQGFRLGVTQDSLSHWFAKNKQYPQLVIEDHLLRQSIFKKFPNAGIARINIERQVETINIDIASARPRQLLGSFNKDQQLYIGIQDLRDTLTKELRDHRVATFASILPVRKQISKGSKNQKDESLTPKMHQVFPPMANISIHLSKLSEPDTSAACLSELIVEQLEKRIPFRRAMKQAILRAQKANVKGIKVQISGRLNGAEIARSEWILRGRVPLHTLRAKVQYNSRAARTTYGLLGVKVWVFTENEN